MRFLGKNCGFGTEGETGVCWRKAGLGCGGTENHKNQG